MARAQVSIEPEHFDLKSCEGGYVKLRRLSYGKKKERAAMTSMSFIMNKKSDDIQAEMAMANLEVTKYEFSNCIVEHNLEKEDGTLFDFKSAADIELLDPRIGEEIDMLITKLNNFEADEGN